MINGRHFDNLPDTEQVLDVWRTVYNNQRPQQAPDMASVLSYPETQPPIE
jgi:hypothetical protein